MGNNDMGNHSERSILRTIRRWMGAAPVTVASAAGAAPASPPVGAREGEALNHDVDYERSDIDARGTFITGASWLIGVWVFVGLIYFLFAHFAHERAINSPPPLPIEAHGNPLPPEPRLQAAPRKDLQRLRERANWELGHYYWVDKSKGKVAIPIERAMDILAARGIPPQKQPPNLVLSQPEAGTRQTGFEGKVAPEPR
jgi:hypothetical protein